ncbi:MAG: hypothetical protein LC114_16505, partial [Bryobacterales bacterium]|nr:hypothetical protein [Bryobacterales bacterium]
VALDREPVLESVLGGGGFAFGGAGSGGVLGIDAVLRNEAIAGFRLRDGGIDLRGRGSRLFGARFGMLWNSFGFGEGTGTPGFAGDVTFAAGFHAVCSLRL